MKRFIRPVEHIEIRYSHDVERIIEICRAEGYSIDADTAQWAWERYSDSHAASWMSLGNDYHIFSIIQIYCEEINE